MCIINHDNRVFQYILTYWLFKITFITFPIHGIMIVFFKRNTFGYFRVIFIPVYCMFLLFGAFRIQLATFLLSWKFFWFWFNFSLFFPLPSALNIHKAPLTGPLFVTASLIISLLPLPVISLVQPTVKPLRRKDLRFFSLSVSRSTNSFFVRCPWSSHVSSV